MEVFFYIYSIMDFPISMGHVPKLDHSLNHGSVFKKYWKVFFYFFCIDET